MDQVARIYVNVLMPSEQTLGSDEPLVDQIDREREFFERHGSDQPDTREGRRRKTVTISSPFSLIKTCPMAYVTSSPLASIAGSRCQGVARPRCLTTSSGSNVYVAPVSTNNSIASRR